MGAPAVGRSVQLRGLSPYAVHMKPARALLTLVLALVLAGRSIAWAQVAPAPPPHREPCRPGRARAPLTALVDQLVDLFPKVAGEVIEVQRRHADPRHGTEGRRSSRARARGVPGGPRDQAPADGRAPGAQPRSRSDGSGSPSVQEAFSQATTTAAGVKPGDRFRASSDKVHLVLLPAPRRRPRGPGGGRDPGAGRATGSDRAVPGVHGRSPSTSISPRRASRPRSSCRARVCSRPRSGSRSRTSWPSTSSVSRASPTWRSASTPSPAGSRDQHGVLRAAVHPVGGAPPGGRFSAGGGPANPPQAKQRSLLARLLGGDLEAGSYSSGEGTIPLRQVARFTFPVLAMDVAVAPADRIPRMVVSDGDQVYMYKIIEQRMEPEWTKSVRFIGRTISVQLADLDGDGVLEVVGNRYNEKVGLNSFVLDDQERQAHVPGGERRRFPLRRRSQGRRRQADAVDAAVQQDGVLHSRSGGPGDHQEGQADRGEAGAGATGLPAHGCGLLQYHGQGHPLARLRRRVQSPPGLDGGRGAMALHHVGGRRVPGGRAGVHVQLADDAERSSTRSSPRRWPSTSTATAWRSWSSPRTRSGKDSSRWCSRGRPGSACSR